MLGVRGEWKSSGVLQKTIKETTYIFALLISIPIAMGSSLEKVAFYLWRFPHMKK